MINFVARMGYFRLCLRAIQNISNKITISCALLIHEQKINKDWLSRVQEVTRGIVELLIHIGVTVLPIVDAHAKKITG